MFNWYHFMYLIEENEKFLAFIELALFLKTLKTVQFFNLKAELPQEGILFCTQFLSLGIFINKKVGF